MITVSPGSAKKTTTTRADDEVQQFAVGLATVKLVEEVATLLTPTT
jgi:hypothetical protein